jgi:hypothetical protein
LSKARTIGTNFETGIVNYLISVGHRYAERRALAGTLDKGDITGLGPRYAIECKAAKKLEIGMWLKETENERINACADYGFLVIKLPRRSIKDCAVLITVEQMSRIITELEESK